MIAPTLPPKTGRLSERTRWLLHFLVLCCPILLTLHLFPTHHHFSLPEDNVQLSWFLAKELLVWGVTFALAFHLSKITARQLCLVTDHPWRAIACGIGWFFAVRIAIILIFLVQSHWIASDASGVTQEKMFEVTHANNIGKHPGFSLAVFGLVSLIAGFSEELWRVGMLRGLGGLFPSLKGNRPGTCASILLVSLIFAMAHGYEGWLGMENAALLGICLGLILVWRRSYWEIATAHVLFDLCAFGVIALFALNPSFRNAQIVYSASRGDIPKIKYLISMGSDIQTAVGPGGVTPLEAAVRHPHPDMVNFLLEKGVNPNSRDNNGVTPLMVAAYENQLQNMKLLFAKGANPNARTVLGFTALRFVAEHDKIEAARLLVEKGADVNLADDKGVTPLATAKKFDNGDLADFLEQHGAK